MIKLGRAEQISFIWGIAEATFFFIVPDVWLSRIAIQNTKKAFVNCLYTLAGAVIGGTILYFAGRWMGAVALTWMDIIPGVSDGMIGQVREGIEASLSQAMMQGALAGIPYKIYAGWFGVLSQPFWLFLGLTVVARLGRFAAVTGRAVLMRKVMERVIPTRWLYGIHIFLWAAFYIWYFSIKGL